MYIYTYIYIYIYILPKYRMSYQPTPYSFMANGALGNSCTVDSSATIDIKPLF